MLLSLSQVKDCTRGAARIEQTEEGFAFFRFTASQAQVYLEQGHTDLFAYSTAPAGVRLAFTTDAIRLSFDFLRTLEASIRDFFSFDLYQNGQLTHHSYYDSREILSGSVSFALLPGKKEVELYLPWSTKIRLQHIALEGATLFTPLRRQGNLLCFGDSITQGYDAAHTSFTYANRLGRFLSLDVINKGIAGEIFRADILTESEAEPIDLITVAYGTNDWGGHSRPALTENARRFFTRLRQLYPKVKIYAISPICRLDADTPMAFGAPCQAVALAIQDAVCGIDNIEVINAWNFTPALEDFYWDKTLHPNDSGFDCYACGLYRAIQR